RSNSVRLRQKVRRSEVFPIGFNRVGLSCQRPASNDADAQLSGSKRRTISREHIDGSSRVIYWISRNSTAACKIVQKFTQVSVEFGVQYLWFAWARRRAHRLGKSNR